LDKLTDLPLLLSSKLSSNVNLDVYGSFDQASTSGKRLSTPLTLAQGEVAPIYVAALNSQEKFMKNYTPGQYLAGTLTFSKVSLAEKFILSRIFQVSMLHVKIE